MFPCFCCFSFLCFCSTFHVCCFSLISFSCFLAVFVFLLQSLWGLPVPIWVALRWGQIARDSTRVPSKHYSPWVLLSYPPIQKAWVNVGPKDIWQPIMVAQAPGQRCNPCMLEHDMVGPRILLQFIWSDTITPQCKNRKKHRKEQNNEKNKGKQNNEKRHKKESAQKTNKTTKDTGKNIWCLMENAVTHGFAFGLVDMVHFDWNSTTPWLKTFIIWHIWLA